MVCIYGMNQFVTVTPATEIICLSCKIKISTKL